MCLRLEFNIRELIKVFSGNYDLCGSLYENLAVDDSDY
ncbi:hypothetical protein AciX9_4262 (plasmid) [Granulicella tundricola MP5ACTX9]|uniref:Uncharacterized protein n=1 Tax=Granulicella tundricola (strain ATCC BAA-1859 / DSM 23138 / MP5ACTX9) TaxID=1198114 RepID=E8X6F3_GRATM|nr:hypothetical protein AciX9_4262 [Granulicella tundricola MP5ACTX9]